MSTNPLTTPSTMEASLNREVSQKVEFEEEQLSPENGVDETAVKEESGTGLANEEEGKNEKEENKEVKEEVGNEEEEKKEKIKLEENGEEERKEDETKEKEEVKEKERDEIETVINEEQEEKTKEEQKDEEKDEEKIEIEEKVNEVVEVEQSDNLKETVEKNETNEQKTEGEEEMKENEKKEEEVKKEEKEEEEKQIKENEAVEIDVITAGNKKSPDGTMTNVTSVIDFPKEGVIVTKSEVTLAAVSPLYDIELTEINDLVISELDQTKEAEEKKPKVIYFQMPVLKTSTKNFKFAQFLPKVPSTSTYHMYQQIFYKAVLKVSSDTSPADLVVEVVTTQRDVVCPDGALHSIRLYLRGPVKTRGYYVYGASSILVCAFSNFTFNYRAKHLNDLEWTNPPMQPAVKGAVKVINSESTLMHPLLREQPNFVHIVDSLYMGDALALDKVPLIQFSEVLCVDAELPDPWWLEEMEKYRKKEIISLSPKVSRRSNTNNANGDNEIPSPETKNINTLKNESTFLDMSDLGTEITTTNVSEFKNAGFKLSSQFSESVAITNFVHFHRIPFPYQTDKPIPSAMLIEAVNWVRSKVVFDKPTLIVSTHAFRRAPNVALAYLFRQKIKPTIKECFQLIACKRPIILTPQLQNMILDEFSTTKSDFELSFENAFRSRLRSKGSRKHTII